MAPAGTTSDTPRDRHALVTGAGRGIGEAVARALAAAGARVTLLGRDRDALARTASELGARAAIVTADVADLAAVEAAFGEAVRAHGPVDILVNNAGIAASAPFTRLDPEHWNGMLAVNLTGTYHCTRQVVPAMVERGFGRIVNVASITALRGFAYVAAYAASKHGVVGLTRALAVELAKTGVTVNAVCPGYTETEMLERTLANIQAKTGRSRGDALRSITRMSAMDRVIRPQEVADAVLWLARPESAAITGQAIAIAGGDM